MVEWVEYKEASGSIQYSYATLSGLVELHCHRSGSGYMAYVDVPSKRLTFYADTLEAMKLRAVKEARKYLIRLHTDFTTALNTIGDEIL